eukprot:gnl/MRDRNA2_/MRDRNA2_45687_c0_seq1.p1 gnl/MRDRNA2_/MRDRNA2_45687_c0~~gnl/MRDRNA2_/MRDRNA2_45687_c0_seq1.p1  ORF type:complete len:377 (-),score=79.14 gnl/MRDRNA2_/MRDRNA2_45687_c0_seq1:208-1338(-)
MSPTSSMLRRMRQRALCFAHGYRAALTWHECKSREMQQPCSEYQSEHGWQPHSHPMYAGDSQGEYYMHETFDGNDDVSTDDISSDDDHAPVFCLDTSQLVAAVKHVIAVTDNQQLCDDHTENLEMEDLQDISTANCQGVAKVISIASGLGLDQAEARHEQLLRKMDRNVDTCFANLQGRVASQVEEIEKRVVGLKGFAKEKSAEKSAATPAEETMPAEDNPTEEIKPVAKAVSVPIPDSDDDVSVESDVSCADATARRMDYLLAKVPMVSFLRIANIARLQVPHVSCTVRDTFLITSRMVPAICDYADRLFSVLQRGTPVRLVGLVGAPHFNGVKGFIHTKAVCRGRRYVNVHFPDFPRPFGDEWQNWPVENVCEA